MALRKVQGGVIADNAITSTKIASGTITVADISNSEITADKLSTSAIADKLGYTPVSPTDLSSLETTVNTKTTIGKAIAMTIVFGG